MALLRKVICNIRHLIGLRHPVRLSSACMHAIIHAHVCVHLDVACIDVYVVCARVFARVWRLYVHTRVHITNIYVCVYTLKYKRHVCMHLDIWMHALTCMLCVCVCVFACVCVCMWRVCTHTRTFHICTYVHIRAYVCTYIIFGICIYVYTTCIHTYVDTHIHDTCTARV